MNRKQPYLSSITTLNLNPEYKSASTHAVHGQSSETGYMFFNGTVIIYVYCQAVPD